MSLPDPKMFIKAIGVEMAAKAAPPMPSLQPVLKHNLSVEFRMLITQYCANQINAVEFEEVEWNTLAKRLGTRMEFLLASAAAMNEDGSLWVDVLGERIRRTWAAKIFRDITWEKLESQAVGKLLLMLDAGVIRDAGELLAIASAARRSGGMTPPPQSPPGGGGNMTMNIGFGLGVPTGDLPEAGSRLSIDLSPRTAAALSKVAARPEGDKGNRVIDSEMVTAEELRNMLAEKTTMELQPVVDMGLEESKGEKL